MNCAAIPKDLLESELFGHERGAFTGATARHLGYAERARDGILFLDEIGELDLKLQAKLLRLLEDRSFHRVGGEVPVPFAGRLVCATNADLARRVEQGTFREDLLYRINVLTVSIPPLRERPEDTEWLAERFVEALATDAGVELSGLTASALSEIRAHAWPGNVRELRNRIERAIALAPGPWIRPGDLFPDRSRRGNSAEPQASSLESIRDEAERREISERASQERRRHRQGRRGPGHLAHNDVGENAAPPDRDDEAGLRCSGFRTRGSGCSAIRSFALGGSVAVQALNIR